MGDDAKRPDLTNVHGAAAARAAELIRTLELGSGLMASNVGAMFQVLLEGGAQPGV